MKKKLLTLAVLAMCVNVSTAQYCMSAGPSSTIDTNVQGVTFPGESSTISYTGCPGVTGVENQLDEVADLFIGSTYGFTIAWGTCGGLYGNVGSAWIDWDGDETFQTDELVATRTYYGGGYSLLSYSVTVPVDAVEGDTRMRVMQRESGSLPLDPCGSFSWGSVVDFTVNISTPCEEMTIAVSDYELCEGEMLTLDAEGLGAITWTGGAVDAVPFVPGPPGVYSYLPSSDDEGDCPVAPADAIVIEVFGLPTVLAGAGDQVFCENENITLSAAGDADVYTWNDGEPLDLMPGPGTYTFVLSGEATAGGCVGAETLDEVTVEVVELPAITATADNDVICEGLDVTLNGGGGETYVWDLGVMNNVPFTPGAIGTTTYTVTGTDENNCSNSASVEVEVVENISLSVVATDEIAGADGALDLTVTGGSPAYAFDWDNDGTGDFDDTEDLTGLLPETYVVVVTDEAGCEATGTYTVSSQLGIEDLQNSNLSVYPNPTVDNINIELDGTFQYQLVAINGDVLINGTATNKETISMADFSSGIYFINVKTGESATTLKVVKK